jgi:hypothetical protein
MIIRGTLVFIDVVIVIAAVLLGHPCLVFAVETLLKLAAAALLSVVGA